MNLKLTLQFRPWFSNRSVYFSLSDGQSEVIPIKCIHSPFPGNSIDVNVHRLLNSGLNSIVLCLVGNAIHGSQFASMYITQFLGTKTLTAKSATDFRFLPMPFLQVFNLYKEKQTKERMSVPYYFDSFLNTTSGTQLRSTKDTRSLTAHIKLHLCV